jgi:protein-S-isoprenylcysteine O-methyltransferase Ste14
MGQSLLTGIRAALYGTGFILLWWWAAVGVREFDRNLGVALPIELVGVGVALIAAGGVLASLCVFNFVATGRGTPAPFDAPREFVAVGPYRFVRNPMYIGGAMMIAGFGLYQRSISIVVFSGVFLVVAHLFVSFYEEPTLADRFGDSYLAYKRTTHRWLPHA